jgi:DNA polymerase-4
MRKIVHVDMDAFYAAVEQRDDPSLRGRPVVIGGPPNSRGVVATCSYEAREYGIHSAMPSSQAGRLCPHAVFVKPRIKHYLAISKQIREVFDEVSDLVEPLSLDEAYLDVTENHLGEPLAGKVAKHVKRRILQVTGLTASAGVGPSKFIAKVASDLRKPDGLVIVPPDQVQDFIDVLPVSKIWGVGPATAKRLHALGLRTAKDIRLTDREVLDEALGKHGRFLWKLANGEDSRVVSPWREPKSRGAECTFSGDILDLDYLGTVVEKHSKRIGDSLARNGHAGRTITLKLRYADFTTITRSRSLPVRTADHDLIASVATDLMLTATSAGSRPVRLVGVSVSGFGGGAGEQLALPF